MQSSFERIRKFHHLAHPVIVSDGQFPALTIPSPAPTIASTAIASKLFLFILSSPYLLSYSGFQGTCGGWYFVSSVLRLEIASLTILGSLQLQVLCTPSRSVRRQAIYSYSYLSPLIVIARNLFHRAPCFGALEMLGRNGTSTQRRTSVLECGITSSKKWNRCRHLTSPTSMSNTIREFYDLHNLKYPLRTNAVPTNYIILLPMRRISPITFICER